MKIDPNQLVGGSSQTLRTYTEPYGQTEHIAEHVGGIPLRLEIAARILAGSMHGDMITLSDCSRQVAKNCVEYALDWADALIDAHNATSRNHSRMDRAAKLLADIAEHIADRVDVVDGSDGEPRPNEWMSMQTEFGDRLYEFTKIAKAEGGDHD